MSAIPAPSQSGLSGLSNLPLTPEREDWCRTLQNECGGTRVWRTRKTVELRELLALEQASPRMKLLAIDVRTDLVAALRIDAPIPYLPSGSVEPLIASRFECVVRYPEVLLQQPLPGTALVHVLRPRGVFLANVSAEDANPGEAQVMCLGTHVQRGLPLREVILTVYGAATLQSVNLDVGDAAGVMNREAAEYWQTQVRRLPLTREPFLAAPREAVS